jgi:hypothetical protein
MAVAKLWRFAVSHLRAGVLSPGSHLFGRGMAVKKTVRRKTPAQKINHLLATIEQRFDTDVKCSVGDYLRLLQAQQEFDRSIPRNIEVTWVDTASETIESEK